MEKRTLEDIKRWRDTNAKAKRLGIKSTGEAAPYLVELAKEFGIDLNGVEHETSNEFENHAIKEHGNPASEALQNQLAVTKNDFKNLADIVNLPDKAMAGVKNQEGKNIFSYAKKMPRGTYLLAEEHMNSKQNNSLRGKTMVIKKNDITDDTFKHFAGQMGKNDLTNSKIVGPIVAGGYSQPVSAPKTGGGRHSTNTTGQLSDSNIPQSYPDVNNIQDKIFHMKHQMSRV